MEDRRRVLFSIHGIRSEGEWQEAFEDVFNPHFRFIRYKYGEFRHSVGAVLWLALELWGFLVGAGGIILLWRIHWLHGWKNWVLALWFWFVGVLIASVLAETRRNRVVKKFVEEIDRQVQNERNPHVIAHSLGSFVVGRLLQRYAERDFEHIILMGCVLTRRYAWQELADRFEMVRNEVSGRDWVAAVAVFLRPFIAEMGSSGIKGFHGEPSFIRTLRQSEFGIPWRPCVVGCVCGYGKIDSPESRVLNVRCPKLGHNDMAKHRARLVWLPFLWNIPPRIHREFVELCQECAELEKTKVSKAELAEKAKRLRAGCWFWTRGRLDCKRLVNRGRTGASFVLLTADSAA